MDTQYYTYDLPASSDSGRSNRPYRRARSRRRRAKSSRRKGLLVLLLAAAVAGLLWWRFGPRPYYTAQQLGIPAVTSPNDGDGDGVEDYADMVAGIRAYFDTKPHYASKYYAGGYPDDGLGVCTDVVWQGFRAAGYQLKELVDADIAACSEAYPYADPDPNIDFRRVVNLDDFFRRHAQVLTNSFDDPSQWQAGDIVVFGDCEHIAVCSDKRDRKGIPFILHHGNPIDEAVERPDIYKRPVTGHYRWLG